MEITISVFIKNEQKGMRNITTPCVLGRSKDANLTIAHPAISRKHCELYEKNGYLYIKDLASLNGTGYNGEIITDPVVIKPNEFFYINEVMFYVNYELPQTEMESVFIIDEDDDEEIVDLALLPDVFPRETN